MDKVPDIMKALTLTEYKNLVYGDVPEPEISGMRSWSGCTLAGSVAATCMG